jgi:hypothetical protein
VRAEEARPDLDEAPDEAPDEGFDTLDEAFADEPEPFAGLEPFAPVPFAELEPFAEELEPLEAALLARPACGERAAAFFPRTPLTLARGAITSSSSAAAAARAAAAAAFFFAR